MMRIWRLGLLVLLAATVASGPARADEQGERTEQARTLVKQAQALYSQGQYNEALVHFEQAYALVASPRIMINIGSTLIQLDRYADAANAYQTYLRSEDGDQARRQQVEALLADKLAPHLAALELRVHEEPGLQVYIDDVLFEGPVSGPIWCQPGMHRIRVDSSRHDPRPIELETQAGQKLEVTVPERSSEPEAGKAAEPAKIEGTQKPPTPETPTGPAAEPGTEPAGSNQPEPPPAVPDSPVLQPDLDPRKQRDGTTRRRDRVVFWSALATTGVGIGASIVTYWQVKGPLKDKQVSAIRALDTLPGPPVILDPREPCADAQGMIADATGETAAGLQAVLDACSAARSRAALSNAFQVITAVSAVASAYFFYRGYVRTPSVDNPEKPKKKRKKSLEPRLVPVSGPHSVGAVFTVHF